MQNIISSAIATGLAEIITLPICTIKTNYQNTQSGSIKQTAKSLYGKGGWRAFYAASPVAIGSQILSTSSKYVLYRYLDDKNFRYSNKMVNGIISGILSTLLTHPFDAVKIHWQMGTSFKSELQKEGFRLFYRGYSKSFFKVCVGSSLFFPLYDYANECLNNSFVASLISGSISTTIMHPIDYLKTRHIYGKQLYQGMDPRIYYKGLWLNLARVVPHFIIVMTTIDYIKSKY